MRAVDGPTRLGRMKGPTSAIGIQGDGQAPGREHGVQSVEHRGGGLARPELGIEQPLGGVVQHGDEGRAQRGRQAQPGMRAAIEMQELAEAGPRLPAAPVPPAGPAFAHEAGFLQGELDEAVRQGDLVIAASEPVEVPHVPTGETLAVQADDALHLEGRRFPGRRQLPAIIEGDRPARVEAGPPPPQTAGLHPEDVRGLQPREFPTQRSHEHLLPFHGPLHRGCGQHHGHLLGYPWL